jgi:hypothetical protein
MGKSKKTVKTEEGKKQKDEIDSVPKEKLEKTMPVEKDTDDTKPVIRILSHGSCPKLSARGVGDLEYEVGIDDEIDEACIRIAGNASSGAYSTKWVKLSEVRAILDSIDEEPFKASVLSSLYAGQSNSNVGYIGAILKAVGVLVGVDKPPSALKVGSWDMLMKKITELKNEGVSLTDEIAATAVEKAKKKQAAADKRKTVKKKPASKS